MAWNVAYEAPADARREYEAIMAEEAYYASEGVKEGHIFASTEMGAMTSDARELLCSVLDCRRGATRCWLRRPGALRVIQLSRAIVFRRLPSAAQLRLFLPLPAASS